VFSGTVLWFEPERGVGGVAVWIDNQTGHGHLTRDA
jgi:hypothetical protein